MSMEFAPLELCKKLVALGCKSESRDYYFYSQMDNGWGMSHDSDWTGPTSNLSDKIYAFVQNDFTGATEQAIANCKIVWEKNLIGPFGIKHIREMMMYCHLDGEIWYQYLERTREENIANFERGFWPPTENR